MNIITKIIKLINFEVLAISINKPEIHDSNNLKLLQNTEKFTHNSNKSIIDTSDQRFKRSSIKLIFHHRIARKDKPFIIYFLKT